VLEFAAKAIIREALHQVVLCGNRGISRTVLDFNRARSNAWASQNSVGSKNKKA
jgi:hypothetical protein